MKRFLFFTLLILANLPTTTITSDISPKIDFGLTFKIDSLAPQERIVVDRLCLGKVLPPDDSADQELYDGSIIVIKIYKNDEFIGFACLKSEKDYPEALYINHFFIDPDYQGKDIGKSLFLFILDYYWDTKIFTLKSLPSAIGFYLKLGFSPIRDSFEGHMIYKRNNTRRQK